MDKCGIIQYLKHDGREKFLFWKLIRGCRIKNRSLLFLSIILLIPVISEGNWTYIGNYTAPYQVSGNTITFNCTNAVVKLEICKADIVRIRMVKAGDSFAQNEPYTILKYDWPPTNPTITDEGTYIKIVTGEMVVRVQKSPYSIGFYKLDNTTIITKHYDNNGTQGCMGWDGNKRGCWLGIDAGGTTERFYGFGIQAFDFEFRGDNVNIFTEALFGMEEPPMGNAHVVMPFFLSSAGYGILNHTYWGSQFEMGSSSPDYISMWFPNPAPDNTDDAVGEELDYYFFYGPSFKEIVERFSDVSGKTSMPPKWALGLQYRAYGMSSGDGWSASDFINYGNQFRSRNLPLDSFGLEPLWQKMSQESTLYGYPSTYLWNTGKFPDPQYFLDQMAKLNIKVHLWEQGYVGQDAPFYSSIVPYSATGCLPSAGAGSGGKAPDFTLQAARDLFWNYHKTRLVDIPNGVAGFKTDENDENISSNCDFPGKFSSGNEMHNPFGFLNSETFHEGYRSLNKRTFLLSRGNYTGAQRYPSACYSDYQTCTEKGIRATIAGGFCGTNQAPEIRSDASAGCIQLLMFSAFSLDNEYQGTTLPWDRSAAEWKAYYNYDRLRSRLKPYIYSCWRVHNKTGINIIRPLIMEYQADPKTWYEDQEYMYGDYMLVSGDRSVYLPAGKWYNYHNGTEYKGPLTLKWSGKELPLFVKGGAIIPQCPVEQYIDELPLDPLTLLIYPYGTSSFTLYEDDGITFNYEKGDFCETLYEVIDAEDILIKISARNCPGTYTPVNRNYWLEVHSSSVPIAVKNNAVTLTLRGSITELSSSAEGWYNDITGKITYVKFADDGTARAIHIQVLRNP